MFRFRSKAARLLALSVSFYASMLGAPMSPEMMRELLESESRAKQTMRVRKDEDKDDDPPPGQKLYRSPTKP